MPVEISASRKKDIYARRDDAQLRSLRQHPYFNRIVKRLVAGECSTSIARWLARNVKPPDPTPSFFTWRERIKILHRRIKEPLAEARLEVNAIPEPALVEQVVELVRRDNDLEPIKLRPYTQRTYCAMKRAIRELNCEKMIKVAFMHAMDRLEDMHDQEQKSGERDKDGYKELLVIKDLAETLRKFEADEQGLRGGKSYAYGGEFERKKEEPVPEVTISKNNALTESIGKLDEIDRNLLMSATSRVIDIVNTEIKRANSTTGTVEADRESQGSADDPVDSGPDIEDESGSAEDIQ